MPNAIANGDTSCTPQGFWLQVREGDWLIQVDKTVTRKTWGHSRTCRATPRQVAAAGEAGRPAPRPATGAVWFWSPHGRRDSYHH